MKVLALAWKWTMREKKERHCFIDLASLDEFGDFFQVHKLQSRPSLLSPPIERLRFLVDHQKSPW